MKLQKVALVISAGTTPDPLIKAVEEATREGTVSAFLIYGRPFPGQEPNPFKVVAQVAKRAEELGIKFQTLEIGNPEDLDDCLKVSSDALRMAEEISPDKTIVDFTGGTKAMSAALVHAALTKLQGNLTFEYIGGRVRDEYGRVKEEMEKRAFKTAVEAISRRAIELARGFNYSQALAISEELPQIGKANFLKRAIKGLWLWDNFCYEEALNEIRGLGEAKVLVEDELLGGLADTILRLREYGNRLIKALGMLRGLEEKALQCQKVEEDILYPLCDFLENAERRFLEDRFADAVLRSYRAVESAVQISLIALGINPWQPGWETLDQEVKERYLQMVGRLPEQLSLFNGFALLESLKNSFDKGAKEDLKSLANLRNHCHLEHGYVKIPKEAAQGSLYKANRLCEKILAKAGFKPNLLMEYRRYISHRI